MLRAVARLAEGLAAAAPTAARDPRPGDVVWRGGRGVGGERRDEAPPRTGGGRAAADRHDPQLRVRASLPADEAVGAAGGAHSAAHRFTLPGRDSEDRRRRRTSLVSRPSGRSHTIPRRRQRVCRRSARVPELHGVAAVGKPAVVHGYLHDGAARVRHRPGAPLVNFDYWLDCPPRSAQDNQVLLHQRLFKLHPTSSPQGGLYFHPIVAYNPWTDIEQDDAGLVHA